MSKVKKLTKKELNRQKKLEWNKKWKEVREKVIQRDRACVLCGITQEELLEKKQGLNVHHILQKEFKIYRYLEFDERNLVTVCSNCHKWGVFSFHKCPLFALDKFKKLHPKNYNFLLKEVGNLNNSLRKREIIPKGINTPSE